MEPSVFMLSLSSASLCHMDLISCTVLTLSHKGCICIVLEKHTWQHLGDHIPTVTAFSYQGDSHSDAATVYLQNAGTKSHLHPPHVLGCLGWHRSHEPNNSPNCLLLDIYLCSIALCRLLMAIIFSQGKLATCFIQLVISGMLLRLFLSCFCYAMYISKPPLNIFLSVQLL